MSAWKPALKIPNIITRVDIYDHHQLAIAKATESTLMDYFLCPHQNLD